MPAPIVTSAAKIICAHGGQITLAPKQFKVLAGGQPVMCVGDLVGGNPVLLAAINAITSAIPPSPMIVAFPGQTKALA